MDSRQRILTALSGRVPDRVPISTYELCGFNSSSFENNDPSYAPLMSLIREKTDSVCMWTPQSNASFFGSAAAADCDKTVRREGNAVITHYLLHTPKGDISQTVKEVDTIHTVWQTEHWCKTSEDVDCALTLPFQPLDFDISGYDRLKREVGDHGIIMGDLGDAFCGAFELMGFGDAAVWAMTETDHFAKTVEIMHERVMENLKRLLDVNVADLYRIYGAEYATPPYLPPEFFNRYERPCLTEMIELIHSRGSKARIHSHGRIGKILKMMMETGADAIDPCEEPPDGDIALSEIKKMSFGKLCLFGNLELKLLEHGSPDEVRQKVKECMESAKEGGGFVIMPTASPINSPLSEKTRKNYEVFIEAALEYGKY